MKTKTQQVLAGAVGLVYSLLTAALALLCTEWIQRGTLENLWVKYIQYHEEAFLAAGILLWLVYELVFSLTRWHPLAVLVTGCVGCIPATVTFFKLQLRSEPFFPWDLAQVSEAADVASAAGLTMQNSMTATLLIFAMLIYVAFWIPVPKRRWYWRVPGTVLFAAAAAALIGGVFLDSERSQSELRVTPDMWNQARYYRNYGVITAFLTNIQTLQIQQPANYSANSIAELVQTTQKKAKFRKNLFEGSYGSQSKDQQTVSQPDILYIMDESFWDAAELEAYGVEFDRELTPNLTRLRGQAAYGKAYSPSFGGGTCDVEFEALTGYSVSFLPNGSKPYQQHVTKPMFALPNYLKTQGYQTAAVHCFWAKYWSRDTAYPNLGLDTFLSLEKMHGVNKVRKHYWTSGLVTDDSMADQIIQQYESMKASSDAPVFLHAVTMQNHTNYNKDNYPDDERVKVLEHPAGLKASTVGALEDFATGIRDADAMLGKLTEYFSQVDEPVILVFWGDHYNPIDSNYDVFTRSGYASDSSADPKLHQTTLLMWSNYTDKPVDLGTIAAYDISPVMMNIYGLKQPLYFQYLNRQLQVACRSNTRGTIMNRDGTTTDTMTALQQKWNQNHWMLQYDLMFGKGYALDRMGMAGLGESSTDK